MSFDSIYFGLFLIVAFFTYWSVKPQSQWQNVTLLLFSYFFYGCWNWRLLALILFSSSLGFFCGRAINDSFAHGEKTMAKIYNLANIVVTLSILMLFKYLNFFASSAASMLRMMGVEYHWTMVNVVLPVGISFYTFQIISYTVDVYRQRITAERSFVNFATYISFFPQLVAGPIERASCLLPQLKRPRFFSKSMAIAGCRLMLWGFFKKLVVADGCADNVNAVFGSYDTLGTSSLLFGAVMFAFQIYADFSGYSDIAVGTAKLFGVSLSRNFSNPYFATNIPDFWRRWHITLTSWLRDYVYIPLGGSRCGRCRNMFNTLAVFSLSGLWHGANWTFICWGVFHGLMFIPYNMRWFSRSSEAVPLSVADWLASVRWFLKVCLTFSLVSVGWVFFRSSDVTMAFDYLCRMFSVLDFSLPAYSKSVFIYIFFMLWAEYRNLYLPSSRVVRWGIYYALIAVIFYKVSAAVPFIYFQF